MFSFIFHFPTSVLFETGDFYKIFLKNLSCVVELELQDPRFEWRTFIYGLIKFGKFHLHGGNQVHKPGLITSFRPITCLFSKNKLNAEFMPRCFIKIQSATLNTLHVKDKQMTTSWTDFLTHRQADRQTDGPGQIHWINASVLPKFIM